MLMLVLGSAAVVVAVLYALCMFQGERVASFLEERLHAVTDASWHVRGAIRPVLLPVPGFRIEDVSLLSGADRASGMPEGIAVRFSLKKIQVGLDLSLLVRGTVWPERLELDSPALVFARSIRDGSPQTGESAAIPPSGNAPVAGNRTTSASSPVETGTEMAGADPAGTGDLPAVSDVLRELCVRRPPRMLVRNGTVTWRGSRNAVVAEFANIAGELDPNVENAPLVFSAQLAVPAADVTASLEGSVSPGGGDVLAKGQLRGKMRLAVPSGSRPVAGELSTSLVWNRKDAALLLPDLAFAAEGDSLTADVRADLSSRSCTGTVHIGHLSLPRWFKFGRNLPPGLQALLGEVRGSFDLSLTPTSAEALSLSGTAGDLAVEGYVGVTDFARPVVKVDVTSPTGNLDPVFPFLSAVGTTIMRPEEQAFPFPPLAPYPGMNDTGTLPEVGYDVRVRVASVQAHRVSGGPLEVLVFPAGDDARVTFTAENFLGGHVKGRLDIGEHRVAMRYDVGGAQIAPLPENIGSSVTFAGILTGNADIGIRVLEDGRWDDRWQFTSETTVDNLRITSHGRTPWYLAAGKTRATGTGVIHAAREDGIRLEGRWNATARSVAPSWNPKGNDVLSLVLNGSLAWPPQTPREVVPSSARPVMQRRGLNHIYGDFGASGSLLVPLGRRLAPVRGKLKAQLDWSIDRGLISLKSGEFDGLGSYVSGDIGIDASGRGVAITFPANFKLAPRTVLKAWDMLPDGGIQIPELLTGKSQVRADAGTLTFGALDVQADGAPVQGTVSYVMNPEGARREDPGLWKLRLVSQRLDLDRYFPPRTPEEAQQPLSREPWRLNALDGISLDGKISLRQSRLRGLSLSDSAVTLVLQRNKFSVASTTEDFYGGNVVAHVQGALVPEASQVVLSNAHMEFKNVDLGKALYDITKDTSYGGKADLAVEFAGTMRCNADMPAALSGNWSMAIQDGLYPAFLGSETMGLRNTFSRASASGVLDKGVLRWDNFALGGAMVDMVGEGWADLGKKMLDFTLNVTVAKVPTVPVRFSGPFAAPSMTVRGAHAVVYTAQAAGSTVFGLLRGVLELPGRALRGVGELFAPEEAKKTAPNAGKPLPK